MAEGFRYTESGDLRVTEDSDFRITEGAITGEASLSGNGATLFAGLGEFRGVLETSGSGTVSADGEVLYGGSFRASVDVGGTRYTEGGVDIRITEGGDTRVVLINENFGDSVLTASGTKITFNSDMFINVSDVWKESIPYVKYEGEWQEPIAIYKNVSGNWKRVH